MEIPEEHRGAFDGIERLAYAKGYVAGVREAVRRALLRLGAAKFGACSPSVAAAINAVHDVYRIEYLTACVLTASSWDDLLAMK